MSSEHSLNNDAIAEPANSDAPKSDKHGLDLKKSNAPNIDSSPTKAAALSIKTAVREVYTNPKSSADLAEGTARGDRQDNCVVLPVDGMKSRYQQQLHNSTAQPDTLLRAQTHLFPTGDEVQNSPLENSDRTYSEETVVREPLVLKLYRHATRYFGWPVRKALDYRLSAGKEDPLRLSERRGIASINRPSGSLIWIHGVSVGESLSILPLVAHLAKVRPDLHFLVTTGTTTSASLMTDRLPENAFHQFIPIDYPPYVEQFLDHWQPDVAIFVESEFWPNLIHEARKRSAMMAIVNGRISPKSYDNWIKWPRSIRYLLSAFDLIIAQDKDNAERLRTLSGRDVMLFGNLKNAADPLPTNNQKVDHLRKQMGTRAAWLAASTHPSEEEMVFDAHKILKVEFSDLLTTIAPRHPERGDEIAEAARNAGLKVAQRSKHEDITEQIDLYIADTLGELGIFYRINDITLVGGGLSPKGGHNPLEPARLTCAILHGPHIFNFNETYHDMRRAGAAALVRNDRDIAAAIKRLLSDDKTRHALARLASDIARENAERTLTDIADQLLEGIQLAAPVQTSSFTPLDNAEMLNKDKSSIEGRTD